MIYGFNILFTIGVITSYTVDIFLCKLKERVVIHFYSKSR